MGMLRQHSTEHRTRIDVLTSRINNSRVMRTLLSMLLTAAMGVLLAGQDSQKVAYVYCSSRDNPVLTAMVYSSPPLAIPLGHLNCGDKVQVLGRTESWIRIASDGGERYVPMTTLSQRKLQFVALDIPLPPEPRPGGGMIFHVGGGISPPIPIYQPRPEFSDEARKANYEGVCALGLIVEQDGRPSHIRVLSSLGMGLDEKAIEAIKTWKFEPAMKDGHPVRVEIAVEVDFHLESDKIRELKRQAVAGDPKAQYEMGEYNSGKGSGTVSYFDAFVWYSLAERSGYKGSAKKVKEIAKKLAPDDIAKAQYKVNNWQPSK